MHTVYLIVGGNLGKRIEYLTLAQSQIQKHIGRCIKKSSIYETQPWGFLHSNAFLNQVLVLETLLTSREVMETILSIEKELGRIRTDKKYDERTVDIDILFYDQMIQKDDFLEIPHPRMQERKFVLIPLQEIEPDFIHPVFDKTIKQLAMECSDTLAVNLYKMQNQHAL